MSDKNRSLSCIAAVALMFLTFCTVAGPISNVRAASSPQASRPASGAVEAGIASRYPGDEGIERDPRVLFVEDFETGGPDEIGGRWGQIYRQENVSLSDDIHSNSPGYKSIHYKDNAYLYTHTKGVDTLYARFYVKFHEKTGYIHHFVHIVADRTPTPWPKGGAG